MSTTIPVTVLGGTYRERCIEPAVDRLMGSGLRAAGLLSSLGHSVEFVTCIDQGSSAEFAAVCAALQINTSVHHRTGPLAFSYETPVQATTRRGDATADSVAIEGDNVLAFGMVETTWTVEAKTLVIDPQHSSVDALIGASNAERISLILNEHEARNATGQSDVCRAATDLVERGVDSVVIKRGALGGLVARAGALDTFGAIPTATVQPLGSGDAFSAGYFHAWAAGEADPLAAAQFGAQIAAAHSLAGIPQISAELLTGLAEPLTYPRQTLPQIYLAGPFFSVAQRQFIRIVHDGLLHLGIGVFSPLLEIGCGGDEVAEKDLAGLAGCHSVLAILDGEDAGTLFEVGWATHAGIPVTGLAENPNDPAWTMARGTGAFVTADLATALYQSAWAAIRALTSW